MTDSHDDKLLRQLGEHARDAQRKEALRPLGDDFNTRMARQIKDSLDGSKNEEDQPPAPKRSASANRWLALAASAIAAVGLSFVVLTRDALPPLPGYELTISGGATLRSDETRAPLQLGDTLSATLRPDVDIDANLDVCVYRQSSSGWDSLPAVVEISDSGAARIRVVLNEVSGVQAGAQDWWFVIGHRDALPSATQLGAGEHAYDDNWTALRKRFELVP